MGFNPYHYQEEIEKIMSLRGDREVQHDAADKLIRGFLGWVGENRDLRGTMAGRIASDLASMYDSEQPKWFYS